ncbi:MAG: SCO family protein [Schleiferiaceae bacterium]|nr:SCO family protein [Schleiferiaceae bacterium]
MTTKTYDYIKIGLLLAVFGVGVYAAYNITKPKERLPIYSPADLIPEIVPDSLQRIGKDFRIGDFKLIDQFGKPFSEENLKGKIYVAEFFFTTCPSICKDMTAQMKRFQAAFANDTNIVIVSHTVMPEVDTPEILNEYATLHEAMSGKWHFLTGEKAEIYRLARTQYFAVLDGKFEGHGEEHDFIHTENFVLVDKLKRLRGFYDGTSESDVDQLIADVKTLIENN